MAWGGMRTSDLDILMVPGWTNSGPDHWQTRWERKLSTARRVEQEDWDHPQRDAWIERVVSFVSGCTRPVVLIAHSLGIPTIVHAMPLLTENRVIGAFLVAPPSDEFMAGEPAIAPFGAYPRQPLPCRSLLVASQNDPACPFIEATTLAAAWGARVSDAGEAGHINSESGHGPWPEGLLTFAGFLKSLSDRPPAPT